MVRRIAQPLDVPENGATETTKRRTELELLVNYALILSWEFRLIRACANGALGLLPGAIEVPEPLNMVER